MSVRAFACSGMPQKSSWLPCICDPAREAAERGRDMGYVTLWCGTCSAEDHRDTRFYEPPHEVGHNLWGSITGSGLDGLPGWDHR